MSYEIWDRDAAAFMGHFESELEAIAHLREMVEGLTPEGATQTIDRMQLVRLTPEGETDAIVDKGVTLLRRMYVLGWQPRWLWLVERPHPWRRQAWIKGRQLTAGDIVGRMRTESWSPEVAATEMDLPIEAVKEAIEWASVPDNAALIAAEDAEDTLAAYTAYEQDPERQEVARADQQEQVRSRVV